MPRESPSSLEGFPSELILEIFEYLTHFQAYEAFFNLNIRFRHLLTDSNPGIRIDPSSLSKSACDRYNADISKSNIERINTFRISNPGVCDHVLSSFAKSLPFHGIKHLILENIDYACLANLLNRLPSSSLLSSLIITTVRDNQDRSTIYGPIFRLQALKYCQLSLLAWESREQLPISIDRSSPIERLIITNPIYAHELENLLPYTPQLRRLSLCLTWLKLDDFLQIGRKFPATIEVVRFTLDVSIINTREYTNAYKWEQVITSYLPNLRIFDIQYDFYIPSDVLSFHIPEQFDRFITPFWLAHQWFFAYRFYSRKYGQHVLIYSTNPYRYC